jgi:hypothetical protein
MSKPDHIAYLAERTYRCVRANISKSDRDNFMKALRAAVAAVAVVERLEPEAARAIYDRCEEMLLSPDPVPPKAA